MSLTEIRFHGRGGQGAVIASWILAYGFFWEGKHAQAFPTFGAERRGAPVEAFVRVGESFPHLRSKVVNPHYVVVMGEKLVRSVDVASGIRKSGFMLINSTRDPEHFGFLEGDFELKTMDVNKIAVRKGLGSKTSPFINTAILGALAGYTDLIQRDGLTAGIRKFVTTQTEKNIEAFNEAYEQARKGRGNLHQEGSQLASG